MCRSDRLQALPPPRRDSTATALAGLECGVSAERSPSQAGSATGCHKSLGAGSDRQNAIAKTEIHSDALMRSEASMLASFSSNKAICEVPMLDIFLPEDDASPVKADQRPLERGAMQLQDAGHHSYRNQLGSVTAAVGGATLMTGGAQGPDLLALMDEADEL